MFKLLKWFVLEDGDANGSFSMANGSKLDSEPFFLIPPLGVAVGTANGSSVLVMLVVNGSPKLTSLNGSSVNSSSAYRCGCGGGSVAVFVLLLFVLLLMMVAFPHVSKELSVDVAVN